MAITNIMGGTSYWARKNEKPTIKIFSDTPTYKNWPRDCSLEYRYVIRLNKSAMNTFGEEITVWLCTANIDHKWLDSNMLILHSPDALTMFKLTWGELIV